MFQVDLTFDPQKLTFNSARVGAQLTAGGKGLSRQRSAEGEIRLVALDSNQNVIANGIVAYATFTPASIQRQASRACTSADARAAPIATLGLGCRLL